MTERTWIGGGNNRVQSAKNWSPSGAPQAGDSLVLPPGSTISIWGNDLAGDTLQIRPPTPLQVTPPGVDIALSHGAVANIQAVSGYVGQVYISVQGRATLNLSQSPTSIGHSTFGMPIDVWLGAGASLTGALNPVASTFSLTGDPGATYTNDATDTFRGDHATIAVDVLGVGTMQAFALSNAASRLTFEGPVSSGQTIQAASAYWSYVRNWTLGTVEIASPANFLGTAEILDHGVVQIDNLAGAASWIFASNLLTVTDASGTVLDRTKLVSNDPSQSAHGISINFAVDTGTMLITAGSGFSGTL